MKFLFAFATLALFAMINANPYGINRGGYGPNVAYVQEPSYGRGGYGRGGYGSPLIASNSGASAAASAAASNGQIRPGRYNQWAVEGLAIDGSWNAPSRGYGHGGYGRSLY